MVNIKDLTEQEKKELYLNFLNRHATCINALQVSFAKIINENNIADLVCMLDTFKGLMKYATEKIIPPDNKDFESWSSNVIGKC